MQTIVLLDLDDTIFQTRSKCPPGELTSLVPAAFDRDGHPLSFISQRQRQFFEWLSASATVIPVTARSVGAFRRVTLPFNHAAIVDFGAVVLQPDGTLDAQWDSQVRTVVLPLADELHRICTAWQSVNDTLSLGVRVRVISDFEMPLYVVAKHPNGNVAALRTLQDRCLATMQDDKPDDRFVVHFNDNNLAIVPRCLGKERAVEYVLNRYAGDEPRLTLGIGDSLSDVPFLSKCDFAIAPGNSQIIRTLLTGQESATHV